MHFIVRAPRGAGLDLEASNGPVSVRGISGAVVARAENGPLAFEDSTGRIQAETKNGPISLKDCSGTVQANAVNGPVSVAGSGGDTNVSTQNGPISVRLSGSHWDGKLDARARNGPLSLSLPDGFASGVLVESWYPTDPATAVARAAGARVVVVPQSPGAVKGTDTYVAHLDALVTAIARALAE